MVKVGVYTIIGVPHRVKQYFWGKDRKGWALKTFSNFSFIKRAPFCGAHSGGGDNFFGSED